MTRFETPCVHSTRPRVYVQNVSVCAGTNGDVLNVHTVTFFIGKTCVFYHVHDHLNRMLGSSLIDIFLLTMNGPHLGYHVPQRFTKETLESLPA